MQDAWRAYLELAMGLTEASRKRAQSVARRLVGQSGATAAQLQALAEELMSTGMANREAIIKIVRFEVDRALGAVGLATADEVAELTARLRKVERRLRDLEAGAAAPRTSVPEPAGGAATAPTAAGGQASGKAVVPSTPAAKAVAKTAGTGQTPAKKAVAKKAVAKKAVAKQAAARAAAGTETGTA